MLEVIIALNNFLARRLDRPAVIEMTEKDVLNIPGSEWAIFRLGTTTNIVSIDIDTNHFKGNSPEHVTIEGTAHRGNDSTTFDDNDWVVILDKIKLQPHKLHSIKKEIKNFGPFNCVRITIAPDGGISRVRIFGQKTAEKAIAIPSTTDAKILTTNATHSTIETLADNTNKTWSKSETPMVNTDETNATKLDGSNAIDETSAADINENNANAADELADSSEQHANTISD